MRRLDHPFDLERPGSRLALRVSLHAEAAPSAGVLDPPFRWGDVLHGAPPGDAERGPPAYCVPAPELLTAGVRVENALVVRVLETGAVEVEDRIAVTPRALAPVIESEREFVGVPLRRAQEAAWARAEGASEPAALAHRAFARAIAALRAVTRAVATVPDRLTNGASRAGVFLSTPEGRRRFRAGLVDPSDLTSEQKAVTLFVGVSAVLGTLVLAHFAVTLAVPDFARAWRTAFFLFLYAFTTSLGVPLPIEPVLLPAAFALGPAAAIPIAILAKVLAAWMVFFLGDAVHDKLHVQAARRPWLTRLMAASERFAQRFGVFAVATFLAIPGLPDTIALYVFGSLHMRLWKFLLGVAIGGTILYTSVTLGLMALISAWF